jgi:hypothetical protein
MSTLLHLRDMRAPPRRRSSLLALALCGMVALGACAATGHPHATATPTAPQPTKIAARTGDTSLCNVISPSEFARVTGETTTQMTPGTTTDSLTGLREVYCIYSDTSDPQQVTGRGTINFEVAADTQAATSTFQMVKQSFTNVADVRGVGDAAFAGTPGGASAGTGLVVVRGTLLLYLSVGGDPQSVVRVTSRLATLVLNRVA